MLSFPLPVKVTLCAFRPVLRHPSSFFYYFVSNAPLRRVHKRSRSFSIGLKKKVAITGGTAASFSKILQKPHSADVMTSVDMSQACSNHVWITHASNMAADSICMTNLTVIKGRPRTASGNCLLYETCCCCCCFYFSLIETRL